MNIAISNILYNFLKTYDFYNNYSYTFDKYLPNLKFLDLAQNSFNYITETLSYEKINKNLSYLENLDYLNENELDKNKINKIFSLDINFRTNSITSIIIYR